jgi:hypothetical protein
MTDIDNIDWEAEKAKFLASLSPDEKPFGEELWQAAMHIA